MNVNAPNVQGIGYVYVDQVAKHDPMYSNVQALDESIASLMFASQATARLTPAQISSEINRLGIELTNAQSQTQKLIATKQTQYLSEETAAIAQTLAAAGVPNAKNIANAFSSAASGKQQAAYAQAGQDLNAYRNDVVAQDSATMKVTMDQLRKEVQSKLQAKTEELSAREAALSLRQSQADAGARLALQTRLSNLALDDATRKDIQAQLKAIDSKENAEIAAQHRTDASEFASYQRLLLAAMNQRMTKESSSIQQSTASKLQARQSEVVATLKSNAPAALPANLPDATKQRLVAIQSEFENKFNSDAQTAMDSFNKTKSDIQLEYTTLKNGGDLASADAARQLLVVQKQRQDLYAKIIARVTQAAARIAQDRGFRVVIADPAVTPGGYDLTPDVTKAIESLHE